MKIISCALMVDFHQVWIESGDRLYKLPLSMAIGCKATALNDYYDAVTAFFVNS